MKTKIQLGNVLLYLAVPAAVLAFLAAAIPALLDDAALTKTLGLTGLGVGAVVGLVYGVAVRFR